MLAAHRILSAAFPADHARVCGHERSLREFYLAWGRPEAAARWSSQD